MNKLNELYKNILESVDCIVADDFSIQQMVGGTPRPVEVTVGGTPRQLYLPVKEVLARDWDWSQVCLFHPACENIASGQSEVLNRLAQLIGLKIWSTMMTAAVEIGRLAASGNTSLPMKVVKLLAPMSDVSSTFPEYLDKVIDKNTDIKGAHPLLRIKLKQGDIYENIKYNRTCRIVRSMDKEPDPLYGIKTTNTNAAAVKALFNEILFPIEFFAATQETIAPYLFVLLDTWHAVATHLNTVRSSLGKYCGTMPLLHTRWFSDMLVIKEWKRYLPQTFEGNTGVDKRSTVEAAAIETKATAPTGAVMQRALPPAPAASPAPAAPQLRPVEQAAPPAPANNGIPSLEEQMHAARTMSAPMYAAPQPQYMQPQQPQYMQPQPQYMQPQPYMQPQYGGYPAPGTMLNAPAQAVTRGDLLRNSVNGFYR